MPDEEHREVPRRTLGGGDSVLREVVEHGAALRGLERTVETIQRDLKDHQGAEETYRERVRRDMETLSGVISTNTESAKQRMDDFRDSTAGQLSELRVAFDVRMSNMSNEIAQQIVERKIEKATYAGGWKVITWQGGVIGVVLGSIPVFGPWLIKHFGGTP